MYPFIILTIFLSISAKSVDRLSVPEAINVLSILDSIEFGTNTTELALRFCNLTSMEYTSDLRSQLYTHIATYHDNTSWSSKIVALISIENAVILMLIVFVIAFLCSFGRLIYYKFKEEIEQLMKILSFNGFFKYIILYLVSLYIMFINVGSDSIVTNLFGWLTPLFGCIVFALTTIIFVGEKIIQQEEVKNVPIISGLVITSVWFITTCYQQNWIIGIATIVALFATNGFMFGSFGQGYYAGFEKEAQAIKCFGLSLLLNAFMIGIQKEFITGRIVEYAKLFETGVYLWATLAGVISVIILCYYTEYRHSQQNLHWLFQIMRFVYYFGIIYVALC